MRALNDVLQFHWTKLSDVAQHTSHTRIYIALLWGTVATTGCESGCKRRVFSDWKMSGLITSLSNKSTAIHLSSVGSGCRRSSGWWCIRWQWNTSSPPALVPAFPSGFTTLNNGDVSDEHGDRLHQLDIATMCRNDTRLLCGALCGALCSADDVNVIRVAPGTFEHNASCSVLKCSEIKLLIHCKCMY